MIFPFSKSLLTLPTSCVAAGPPQAWLESLGSYDSCGSSGNKYCSFGFNNPDDNTEARVQKSIEDMSKTREACDCLPEPSDEVSNDS